METEKSKLEEALIRAATFSAESSEKMLIEKGLTLFSSALNSELEGRAYEIVELIGDKKLIDLAAKYATKKGRIHVANKVSKLLMDFEEKEKQREALLNFENDVEVLTDSYEMSEMQTPKAAQKIIETSTPLIAPKPMINQKKLNPFKKSVASSSTTPISLNHLTNKSIAFNQTSTNNSDDENTPRNNISSNISMDTPRPGNFGTWFIANKDSLKASNPNASEGDLMLKIGKKIYKELTQKQRQPDGESIIKDNQSSSNVNKRKLNLTEDELSVTGIAKLAKFGFTKE